MANSNTPISFPLGGTMYTQKRRICDATMRVDSQHATLDSAEHGGPCDDTRLTCQIELCH